MAVRTLHLLVLLLLTHPALAPVPRTKPVRLQHDGSVQLTVDGRVVKHKTQQHQKQKAVKPMAKQQTHLVRVAATVLKEAGLRSVVRVQLKG